MAGFDFELIYTDDQAPLVRVCLDAARSRARRLRTRWRETAISERQIHVGVDGNSRRTDLLGYRLERDLPLIAEGCAIAGVRRDQRARLGRGVADAMLRGRHVEQEGPIRLKGVARTRYRYPPYDYDCQSAPELHARLTTTEDLLVAWNFDEIAAEVLLEELHTGCELVLEELVNRRAKKLSFAELIEAADGAGLLGIPVPLSQPLPPGFDLEVAPAALLTELKDLRKGVRHRAEGGAADWLNSHWEDVAILLERLVGRISPA